MIVYGTAEDVIENVSFEDVTLHIVDSPLNDVAGGNFDLRPALEPAVQLFSHDIPGFYAQYVKNLRVRDFDLSWDSVKQPFFTHGIEVNNFEGLSISSFGGTAAPNNPKGFPIVVRNGRGYDLGVPEKSVLRENVKR
jgi:hypothetical protein